jgi:transcriptional regulator with XRE-family HTH domain
VIRVEEPRTLEEAMARKNIPRLRDLAVRVGCSSRSLTGWLHGTHQPSAYYLGQLSRVLDTDAHCFLGGASSPSPMSRRTFMSGAASLGSRHAPAVATPIRAPGVFGRP